MFSLISLVSKFFYLQIQPVPYPYRKSIVLSYLKVSIKKSLVNLFNVLY